MGRVGGEWERVERKSRGRDPDVVEENGGHLWCGPSGAAAEDSGPKLKAKRKRY